MNASQLAAALSADLRRVSYWIYGRQDHLVRPFLIRDQKMTEGIDRMIGRRTLQQQLALIQSEYRQERSRLRAADRALTVSRILWYLS